MQSCRAPGFANVTSGAFWATQLRNYVLSSAISAFALLVHAQIMLLIPVGSVENERSFSDVNLLKSSIRNRLDEQHLNACHRVRRCRFGLGDFPYREAVTSWREKCTRRNVC